MAKLIKYIFILVLFSLLTYGIVSAETNDEMPELDLDNVISNYPYVEQMLLEGSRYTQPDFMDQEALDDYHDNYYLSYSDEDLETLGFELMFDTENIKVYFELDSFSLMIQNKETGYFWSSRPEFQTFDDQDSTFTRNQLNSGLWFDYAIIETEDGYPIDPSRVTNSILNIAEVRYKNDPSYNDSIEALVINPLSYNKRRMELTLTEVLSDSFTVHVENKVHDFSFNIQISLVGDSIDVYIPSEEIVDDTSTRFRLLAIHVFPYFGATRGTSYPGYVMIPDGVGALVRTDALQNSRFQANFFGGDYGLGNMAIQQLSLPIFGIVHEPYGNGYYANIIQGAEYSTLIGNFGALSLSHGIGTRFNYRNIYFNVFNRSGDGYNRITEKLGVNNFQIRYNFLSGVEATYTGMAVDYRNYLISNDLLDLSNEKSNDGNIPLQLSYIMQDREPSFIGTSKVNMTSPSEAKMMYQYFYDEGLTNQVVTLMGWSNDGNVLRQPYQTKISDESGYKKLIQTITDDDNEVYLDNQYIISSSLSKEVNYNRDVARNLSRLKMVRQFRSLNNQITDLYYLYPDRSYAMARSDVSFFESLGISGVAQYDLGSTLFTYYDNNVYTRKDGMNYYEQIGALYDKLMLSAPHAYMFPYLDGYMDMPIANAQFAYYTDLVPIVPIVLKGSISYYTPFLNFNALGVDRLLQMVDFGVNPSFVLTFKPTYEMRYTLSNMFYSTEFDDYKEDIVNQYEFVNGALKHVLNASIIDRQMVDYGISRTSYSNGVIIYVNYSTKSVDIPHGLDILSIDPQDYKVVMPS